MPRPFSIPILVILLRESRHCDESRNPAVSVSSPKRTANAKTPLYSPLSIKGEGYTKHTFWMRANCTSRHRQVRCRPSG